MAECIRLGGQHFLSASRLLQALCGQPAGALGAVSSGGLAGFVSHARQTLLEGGDGEAKQARQAVPAALKACCAAMDQQLGSTQFQQASSGIDASAAAGLRNALGQPGAAAEGWSPEVIALLTWRDRLDTLCPQRQFVVRAAERFRVVPGQAPQPGTGAAPIEGAVPSSVSGSGGGAGSSGNSGEKHSPEGRAGGIWQTPTGWL